jgi:hypothetical protein
MVSGQSGVIPHGSGLADPTEEAAMSSQTAAPGPARTWTARHRRLTAFAVGLVAVAAIVIFILTA